MSCKSLDWFFIYLVRELVSSLMLRRESSFLARFICRKQPNAVSIHSAARSWRRMGRHNIEPMLNRFP